MSSGSRTSQRNSEIMQPLTFACPKCGRRMGVGLDLMGKSVRCPHCRQVVVVPSNVPVRPAAPPDASGSRLSTPPDAQEPSEHGESPMRFAPPPREGAESIFGEEGIAEDSVFEAPATRKPFLLPDVDDSPRTPPGMIDFNATSGEKNLKATDALESDELPKPSLGPPTPFTKKEISQPDFELLTKADSAPPSPPPPPPPPAAPYVIHASPAASRGDDVVDPFAKFSRPNLPALPKAPPPEKVPGRTRFGQYFWPLALYALIATLLAAWGWLRSGPHPFSTIPDFFGQYHPADGKKVSALPVDVNQPFPDALKVKLGGKIVLGDLEFEPLGIEERRTRWEVKADGGRSRDIECLVLTARVRNLSKAAFHPFDPAFNRYAAAGQPAPLTAVVIDGERFAGGPIPWPFVHAGREFITGQEADESPLEPGQQRTTTLPAIDGEKGKKLLTMIKSSTGPALWQVHVRRGFIDYKGEPVSVGALVGVEFDASQVKRAEPKGKTG